MYYDLFGSRRLVVLTHSGKALIEPSYFCLRWIYLYGDVMATACAKSLSVDPKSRGQIAVAEVIPNDSPTDDNSRSDSEKSDSEKSDSEKSRCLGLMCLTTILLSVLVGAALRLIGTALFRPHVEYVCGGLSPSRSELEARKLQTYNGTSIPICLHMNIRDDVMCLRSGDPVDSPPVYCQTNVGKYQGDESGYWYLWFSDCTICGSAWRMFHTMVEENKSSLKLPTPAMDAAEVPLGTKSWLVWDRNVGDWRSDEGILSIEECDETTGVEEEGFVIPSACYVEKVSVSNWKMASNIAFIIGSVLVFCCIFCHGVAYGDGSSGGGGGDGGGGGGGGGGGCGGGGGGC